MKITTTAMVTLFTALLLSPPSFAATLQKGFVSAKQVQLIKAGQTKDEIVNMLGTPKGQPKWRNGTQSLVYSTEDGNSQNAVLYIDIDTATNTVISYIISSNNDSGMGSSE